MIQHRTLDGITIVLAVVAVLPLVLCSIIFYSLVTVFNSLRQARKQPEPYIVEVVEIYGSGVYTKRLSYRSQGPQKVCANHSAIQDKGDLAIPTLYRCQVCELAFSSQQDLEEHNHRIHQELKTASVNG